MEEVRQPTDYTVISLSDRAPPSDDQRRGQRHMTVLQAGKIVTADKQELCLIRNISARGMMAEIFSDFETGDKIGIEFKAGTETRGTIRWVEDGRAGIEFQWPIDVHHVLAPHGASLAPRSPRLSIDGTAMITVYETRFALPVVDISQGGLKIEHRGRLETGDEVIVSIEGLPVRRATVRWSDSETAGIGFTRVMPLDRIAYWAARQRPAAMADEGAQLSRSA
ncbi:MAG: PilZ domain-containing protein [Sphingomonadales bacterium]|nr:PilZ domain-containing protein [Sphingomonadales bacterium]